MPGTCKYCKHAEVMFATDLYCMNPECDLESSNSEAADNYMGVVAENDSCVLFEPKDKSTT